MAQTLQQLLSRSLGAGNVAAALASTVGIHALKGIPVSDFMMTFVVYGGTTSLACALGDALLPVAEEFVGADSQLKMDKSMRGRLMKAAFAGAIGELILMTAGVSSPGLSMDTALEALVLGGGCVVGPMAAKGIVMA